MSSHHWLTADSGPNAPELQPWGQEASDREEVLLFKNQVEDFLADYTRVSTALGMEQYSQTQGLGDFLKFPES